MKTNIKKLRISKETVARLKGGAVTEAGSIQQVSRKETCLCMTITSPCEKEVY